MEVLQILLENGANINAESGFYGNALSGASFIGHVEVVRLLLENGANVNAKGGYYRNALSCNGYLELVRILAEKEADVDAKSGVALRRAAEEGRIAVMRLNLGVNPSRHEATPMWFQVCLIFMRAYDSNTKEIVSAIKTPLSYVSLPFELLHLERSTRKKMAFGNLVARTPCAKLTGCISAPSFRHHY